MMDSEEDTIMEQTDDTLSSEWLIVNTDDEEHENQHETNPRLVSRSEKPNATKTMEPQIFYEKTVFLKALPETKSSDDDVKKLKKEYVIIPNRKPKMSKTGRRAKQETQKAEKGLTPGSSENWKQKNQPTQRKRSKGLSLSSYLMGAIIGDIAGSRFEARPHKNPYDFDLIVPRNRNCHFTDDTVLTIAVADAIMHQRPYDETIRHWAKKYPGAGYGKSFRKWMHDDTMGAYKSWGNGSAMRVGPCGYLPTLEKVLLEAKVSAECTHNHEEGIKGAQATAACIFLARNGKSKEEIKKYIMETFDYDLDRRIENIRPSYRFDCSCQGSVPEAIIAFLEGNDFRHTIRLAISLGGDADTQAAIAGSIAHAYYRYIPERLEKNAREKLNDDMIEIIDEFDAYVEHQETDPA